ncbi:MAG: hypothetical protein M9894_26415 [Planctomycetes bacterium]|nr:hypothetical protein [Planctomycetota bacterium]
MTPDESPTEDGRVRSTEALRLAFNVWLLRAHAADRRPAPVPPAREAPRRRRRRRQA